MSVDIVFEDSRWDEFGLQAIAERSIDRALGHLGLDSTGTEIAILACDDARIAELNSEFRDKAKATNVLSWPSEERGAEQDGDAPDLPKADLPGMPIELGDIAIAWDTCLSEAEVAGKPMQEHVAHLIVHGLLHLLGYDHIRDKDATLMEAVEAEILGKMGIANPYT